MMLLRVIGVTIPSSRTSVIHIQKRFRIKEKWAHSRPKKSSTLHALEHFDVYYKPLYKDLWPSMRVALLSQHKYVALINNFTMDSRTNIITDLAMIGAYDIVRVANENTRSEIHDIKKPGICDNNLNSAIQDQESNMHEYSKLDGSSASGIKLRNLPLNTAPSMDVKASVAPDYMPVRVISSEAQKKNMLEIEQNCFVPDDVKINIMESVSSEIRFPSHLMAFAKSRGDASPFPPAKRDSAGKIEYYLMDAASILPVVALELQPGCKVLDLCAAPGGKSLAILQTLLPETLTCIDSSYTRTQRLKDVMHWFVPKSYTEDKKVNVQCIDGNAFCRTAEETGQYDRVLVDVPCYCDRHVLTEDDNNIFRPSRQNDRLALQERQKNLLLSALCACKPGGIVVYSTCTLSPPQNDGVIRATLEKVWHETNMKIAVENTLNISHRFKDTFEFFHTDRSLGQLVIPSVSSNFGPLYFAKLRRIK